MLVSGGFAGLAGGVMLAGGDFGNYQLVANFGAGIGFAGLLAALGRPPAGARRDLRGVRVRRPAHRLGLPRAPPACRDASPTSCRALLVLALLLPPAILYVRERRRARCAVDELDGIVMGDFFSALGDIVTNESVYRNAMIAAVVLLFAASGELVAEKAGTINISLEGMMLAGAFAAAVGQIDRHGLGVGGAAGRRRSPACSWPRCRPT